ncbi:MAG: sulfotransferase [Actinomycetota bacterium]|nr:sulfotransferase [Actinomycetota bacterium]
MAVPESLPNLIVIGAMKCATTALHRYLDLHPQIVMAAQKEMNFFVGPSVAEGNAEQAWHRGNWHRGVDWYAEHFADAPVRGEASPSYTSPSFPEAAARMAAVVPDARLIYLVRDPIDRALSQYEHHRRMGTEQRGLEEALLDAGSQYLQRSAYHARLQPYLDRFPGERIAIVLQEDLLDRRHETLASLYRFAGVDDEFWASELDALVHVGGAPPELDGCLEKAMIVRVAEDVARLRSLTNRDLAEWRSY